MTPADFDLVLYEAIPGEDPEAAEARRLLRAAAEDLAAWHIERQFHPPYKPARKFDLGHENAKRARTRSDEKESA